MIYRIKEKFWSWGDEFTITVTGNTLIDPGAGEWRIYLLLYETVVDLENPGSNGQTEFRNSVRYVNFTGEVMGEAVDLDPCASFGATAVFEVDDAIVVPANLRALAFIQNSEDGEILDSAVFENGGL